MILFKYIFCKVYFFYVKAFREKEIPHWFASGILSVILIGTIQVMIDFYSFFFNPEIIGIYTSYNKYVVLVLGLSLMYYVSKQKKYLKIIEDCERLPKSKKKVLGYISILYVIVVFVGFFWVGELIRNYNMMH
ncbi:MAG: hypothetical protein EOM83_09500 [Clostridia bacterium]|nr:hypothetical protein [Clostridia bacterium]